MVTTATRKVLPLVDSSARATPPDDRGDHWMPGVRDPENPANRGLGSAESVVGKDFRLSAGRAPGATDLRGHRHGHRWRAVRRPHREHPRREPDDLVVDDVPPRLHEPGRPAAEPDPDAGGAERGAVAPRAAVEDLDDAGDVAEHQRVARRDRAAVEDRHREVGDPDAPAGDAVEGGDGAEAVDEHDPVAVDGAALPRLRRTGDGRGPDPRAGGGLEGDHG